MGTLDERDDKNPYRSPRSRSDGDQQPSRGLAQSELLAVGVNFFCWHLAVGVGYLANWPVFCVAIAVASFSCGLLLNGTTLSQCIADHWQPIDVGGFVLALFTSSLMIIETPSGFRLVGAVFVGCSLALALVAQMIVCVAAWVRDEMRRRRDL